MASTLWGEEEEEEEEEVCNTSNNATIDEFTTSPPTILCTDNPNNIIEKVSPNTSTVNVNIIDDKSYTEQSNSLTIMIILITRFYKLSMKVQNCL